MRFSLTSLPSVLLVFLFLWSSYYEWGLIKALLALIAIFILRLAVTANKVQTTIFSAEPDNKIVLNTISISHYVEKVRFCLDYAGIPYEEEHDCGIMGALFHGRSVPVLNIPSRGISIGNSSDILRYLYATNYDNEKIRQFLEQTPESKRLEDKFDKFGKAIRRLGYRTSLENPDTDELMPRLWGLHHDKTPLWQKYLLSACLPGLKLFITKRMGTERPEDLAAPKREVDDTINEVNALLSDGRAYLLGTDYPTYVDITWAALSAIGLLPDGYGGNALNDASKLRLSDMRDKEHVKEIEAARKTPAGKFALRIYRDFRFKRMY